MACELQCVTEYHNSMHAVHRANDIATRGTLCELHSVNMTSLNLFFVLNHDHTAQ